MPRKRSFRRATATTLSLGGLLIWAPIPCADAGARAQSPLPPVRPPSSSSQTQSGGEATSAPSSSSSTPQPADGAACLAQLRATQVEAQIAPVPPAPLADCGIAASVRVNSIGLANAATIDLPDRPILECAFAVVFTDFVRDLIAPLAAATLGSPVVAIGTGPGYECRSRNRLAGAKTSAHGKGIAIDLAQITLADRRRVAVGRETNPAEALFVRTMRRAACGWFTTVIGPGSDGAHAGHLHFDIARHGASDNYSICE